MLSLPARPASELKAFKVAFSGAPSSRKSTVCGAVEALLRQDGIITDTSREIARCYINKNGRVTEPWEQLLIFEKQQKCNEAIAKVSQVMLCDTPPQACYRYALWAVLQDNKKEGIKEITPAQYELLSNLFVKSLQACHWFDLIFVFPPHDPVVHDGTRSLDPDAKLKVHNALLAFFDLNEIGYMVAEGTTAERIDFCYKQIKALYNFEVTFGAALDAR